MRLRELAWLAAAFVTVLPAVAAADGFDAREIYRVEVTGAPSLGRRDAPVTIVEFSDFLCRYCGRAAETLSELRLLYGDDLRIVYRHSLLDDDDGTLPAEAALAAAAQGRFWAYHDRAFAGDRRLDRAALEAFAGDVGLDVARFRRELDAGRHRAALARELAAANALGVTSTPMFFVNGRPLSGNQPIGVFAQVIELERARAAAARRRGVAAADTYDELTRGGRTAAARLDADALEIRPLPLDPDAVHAVGLGQASQRRGTADALVTIVEFADFDCGFCVRVRPTLAALERKYGGDVRFVLRFLPLGGAAEASLLGEAALAAGEQGQLWQMVDRLFQADALDRAGLDGLAADLGLDLGRFAAALDDRRFRRAVTADFAEGSRVGVRGTPTFFVNGRVVMGAQPQAVFETVIDAELARARALVAAGTAPAAVYQAVTGAAR